MKLFLILCLAFSFSAYADDHEGYSVSYTHLTLPTTYGV